MPRRFPRPDFTSGYHPPDLTLPVARAQWLESLDVLLLAGALALAAHLALRRRSRTGLLALTVGCLAYFGFVRRGCVCAVGAVQNLALAAGDAGSVVPWTVLAIFLLPLLFALFFGRVFCAAVCPLGAVQELVVWRPVRLPRWLNDSLGLLPWIFLCVALLFAFSGSGFLICRWDPFVGFFRMGAPAPLLVFGALLLLTGLFIGRPYCRFLCPYGALLGVMSRVARRHVRITPADCVQCRLCERACPYDAIRPPLPAAAPESRQRGARRLGLILLALLLALPLSAGLGYGFGVGLSRLNPTVALAQAVARYPQGDAPSPDLAYEAFFASDRPADALEADARAIRRIFAQAGTALGILLCLLTGSRLLGLSVWRSRRDYEPDRATCVSCARCFAYCPVKAKPDHA